MLAFVLVSGSIWIILGESGIISSETWPMCCTPESVYGKLNTSLRRVAKAIRYNPKLVDYSSQMTRISLFGFLSA